MFLFFVCIYVMVGTFVAGGRRDRFLGTVHHCPLPAQPPYPPWNKKTTEYSLVELVVVVSYGVSWMKVTGTSARFLYSTSPAMLGRVFYLLGVLNLEDVLFTSASPTVLIHCGDGMGVSKAVDVGDASSHYCCRASFANESI